MRRLCPRFGGAYLPYPVPKPVLENLGGGLLVFGLLLSPAGSGSGLQPGNGEQMLWVGPGLRNGKAATFGQGSNPGIVVLVRILRMNPLPCSEEKRRPATATVCERRLQK